MILKQCRIAGLLFTGHSAAASRKRNILKAATPCVQPRIQIRFASIRPLRGASQFAPCLSPVQSNGGRLRWLLAMRARATCPRCRYDKNILTKLSTFQRAGRWKEKSLISRTISLQSVWSKGACGPMKRRMPAIVTVIACRSDLEIISEIIFTVQISGFGCRRNSPPTGG